MKFLLAVLTVSSVCIASGFGEEVDNGLKAIQNNGELLHNADNLPLINNINPSRTIRDADPKKKNKKSKVAKKGKKGNRKGKRKGKKMQKKRGRKAKSKNRRGKKKGGKKNKKGRKGKKMKKNKKNKSKKKGNKKKGRKARKNKKNKGKKKGNKKGKKKSKKSRKTKKVKGLKSKKSKKSGRQSNDPLCPPSNMYKYALIQRYINTYQIINRLIKFNKILGKKGAKAPEFANAAKILGEATSDGTKCYNASQLPAAAAAYFTLSNCSGTVQDYCKAETINETALNDCKTELKDFRDGYFKCLKKNVTQDEFCTCLDALKLAQDSCFTHKAQGERVTEQLNNKCRNDSLTGSFIDCRLVQRDALKFVEDCREPFGMTTSSPSMTTARRRARILRDFRRWNH